MSIIKVLRNKDINIYKVNIRHINNSFDKYGSNIFTITKTINTYIGKYKTQECAQRSTPSSIYIYISVKKILFLF